MVVEKERSERSASPIEMVYLAKMIELTRPDLFIESGSDIGYSGECICEAMQEHIAAPMFYTVEVDGDEAKIKVGTDGSWDLLSAAGNADRITSWSFLINTH